MESARCKAFVTAAETGSFSKAGEVLGYTPSGVSQLVTSLERELGLPLLGRNRKGVTLTENGRRLLPAVREFLQQENRIYQLAGEMSGLLVGSVTIATYSSVATHWLPQVIRRFRARYPHIQIKLMEGIRQEIIQWLEDKAADLAFFSHKAPMPYDWIPLAEDPDGGGAPARPPSGGPGVLSPGPVCPGGLHHARPGPGRRCSGPAGDPRSGAENCLYHPGHSLSPGHDSE